MKLTNERAAVMLGALNALDSYERVTKAGDNERVVKEFFKFGGALRLDIAKNINRLQVVNAAVTAARNALLQEIAGEAMSIDASREPALAARFSLAERNLLDAETDDLDLVKIKIDALKLDDNPIPGSQLAALAPILE